MSAPRKPAAAAQSEAVYVRLTPGELAVLDAVRGEVSRAEWLRRQVTTRR